MSEPTVLIQYVTHQRTEVPNGLRVLTDGLIQRTAPDNARPGPTELLEKDRSLTWQDDRHISSAQVEAIKAAILDSKFFDLQPRLLINYCKDDPGTMIWTVNVDGKTWRVVVYDPRPRRSTELDGLSKALADILAAEVRS